MASIPSAAQALRAGLLRRSGCPRLHLRLAQDGKEEADDAIGEDDPRRDERGADERDDGLSAQATASAQAVSSARPLPILPKEPQPKETHCGTTGPSTKYYNPRRNCRAAPSAAIAMHSIYVASHLPSRGEPFLPPIRTVPHNPDRQLWSTAATAITVRLRGQATPSHANSSSWAIPVSFCLQWG